MKFSSKFLSTVPLILTLAHDASSSSALRIKGEQSLHETDDDEHDDHETLYLQSRLEFDDYEQLWSLQDFEEQDIDDGLGMNNNIMRRTNPPGHQPTNPPGHQLVPGTGPIQCTDCLQQVPKEIMLPEHRLVSCPGTSAGFSVCTRCYHIFDTLVKKIAHLPNCVLPQVAENSEVTPAKVAERIESRFKCLVRRKDRSICPKVFMDTLGFNQHMDADHLGAVYCRECDERSKHDHPWSEEYTKSHPT